MLSQLQEENLRSMEITRRQFTRLIVSAAILCVASVRWAAAYAAPSRVLRALRPTAFPGRLRPIDDAEVREEGKWKG